MELTCLDRRWVRFERYLAGVGHPPCGADLIEDGVDQFGVHEAGRPAAKENRFEDATLGQLPDSFDLGQIGARPAILVDGRDDVTVKVAIGAFRLAKWPVNVEPKAPVFPILRQSNPLLVWRTHPRGG